MRNVYRGLAYLVALGVVVQAAAIAFGVFGLTSWVEGGGTLDKATMESSNTHFTGDTGFAVHGLAGTAIIPLVALLLLIVSFFAKIPGGVKWALYVFVSVAVQVALGLLSHSVSSLGILHGVVALVLFWVALTAGRRVQAAPAKVEQAEPVVVAN
jgi:hypothetical protein